VVEAARAQYLARLNTQNVGEMTRPVALEPDLALAVELVLPQQQ
jgi:hypothetical protein